MAIRIYTLPKGTWLTTKGSPIHAIIRVQLKEYQKGFDSVNDFDLDNPESDSWRAKSIKQRIKATE